MQDFRKLKVWQKAHQFVLSIYAISARFPDDERFGLTSQVRRAAISIPSNIAEGCGREPKAELRRFLFVAMGSASEADYQLELARDLKFLEHSTYHSLTQELDEIKQMLTGLIQRLTTEQL